MIESCVGWLDQFLSRIVVERRFVSPRSAFRSQWLAESIGSVEGIGEADWFGVPRTLEPIQMSTVLHAGRRIQTVRWALPEVKAGIRVDSYPRTGAPQMTLRASGGVRVWLLLHGWLSGGHPCWIREWPVGWLLEHADVAELCLPGHGPRRAHQGYGWPSFPTRNPLANAIGLALATAELRQAVGWLRALGYEQILIAATSLGANIAALYATVEPDCDGLLLDRPLVRMSEPMHRVAGRQGEPYLSLAALLDQLYRPVNPLSRPLRLDRRKVRLLLGRNDRIADCAAGACLARHFAVEPEFYRGGHVLPLGRRAQLRTMLARLTECDVDRTL